MAVVEDLQKVLDQCNNDMPIFLETEKGVLKEFRGVLMEDAEEYRVVLRAFSSFE